MMSVEKNDLCVDKTSVGMTPRKSKAIHDRSPAEQPSLVTFPFVQCGLLSHDASGLFLLPVCPRAVIEKTVTTTAQRLM
jgi:hypothetical protein